MVWRHGVVAECWTASRRIDCRRFVWRLVVLVQRGRGGRRRTLADELIRRPSGHSPCSGGVIAERRRPSVLFISRRGTQSSVDGSCLCGPWAVPPAVHPEKQGALTAQSRSLRACTRTHAARPIARLRLWCLLASRRRNTRPSHVSRNPRLTDIRGAVGSWAQQRIIGQSAAACAFLPAGVGGGICANRPPNRPACHLVSSEMCEPNMQHRLHFVHSLA